MGAANVQVPACMEVCHRIFVQRRRSMHVQQLVEGNAQCTLHTQVDSCGLSQHESMQMCLELR